MIITAVAWKWKPLEESTEELLDAERAAIPVRDAQAKEFWGPNGPADNYISVELSEDRTRQIIKRWWPDIDKANRWCQLMLADGALSAEIVQQ